MTKQGERHTKRLGRNLVRYSKKLPKKFQLPMLVIGFALLMGFAWYAGWLSPLDPSTLTRYEPGSYKVVRFSDGDTIVVNMNGADETIRFIGIDTPETHKPNAPVQCYGAAASAYTKQRISDQRVRLVSDELTTNRDRYDRLLRYVILEDGSNLNYELVQKGYAFAYSFPFSKSDTFFAAMDEARAANRGLWGNCNPYQSNTGQWHTEDLAN